MTLTTACSGAAYSSMFGVTTRCSLRVREICSRPASSPAEAVTSLLKSERMRCTVSEPTTSAKPQRITNVSSAEASARRLRMGRRSNAAESRRPKSRT